ncbi:MAG: hypothetical protein RIG62_32185 [Cyclobacteriaceae bacterium]
MKSQSRQTLFFAILSFISQVVSAQTTYYSRTSGAWNNPDTWSVVSHGGVAALQVPGASATDIVIIADGDVVDYNAFKGSGNSATVATLTLGTSDGISGDSESGHLRFPFSNYNFSGNSDDLNADFDLTVTGDVNVYANGYLVSVQGGEELPAGNTMSGSANDRGGHDIFIQGNLSNTGVLDLQNDIDADYEVELHFTGTTDQTISGEGTWDTYTITYNNTGILPANQIENQSENFTGSVEAGRSVFTQGTYVHNNSGIYNNRDNGNTTYTDVSFIIQGGIFNMMVNNTANRAVTLTNGTLTITGGQFNGGHGGVGSGFATAISVDGDVTVSGIGTLNVGDGDPGTTTTPSSGNLTVGGSSSTVNSGTLYTFHLYLNAGANLSLENGAAVSVGQTGTNQGSIFQNGAPGNGSAMIINDATTQLTVYDNIFIQEDCSFTLNNGTVDVTPDFISGTDPESIQIEGVNASFTMLEGTLNVMTSNADPSDTNFDAIILEADNTLLDIQGGTVTLGNGATGRGRLRFRQAVGETANFSASNAASITVADAIQRNNVGSITNITLSDDVAFLVGTDNSSGNVGAFNHEGMLSISDNAVARFGNGGDLQDISISGNGTLETGTTATTSKVDINGTLVYNSTTTTCTFYSGMDIEAGASVTITDGTLDILPDATTASDTRMQIRGDLVMDGGTINLGAGITNITGGNLLQIYDGGSLTINSGTFNILSSPALTSLANVNPFNVVNNDAGEDATPGDGIVTVGDGAGGATTAQLIIAPNLASELPSPSTRNIFDMDGPNSVLTVNSDGYLGIGGGNIGNLRLNTAGAHFMMNGGTCDITASLTLDNGTELDMNSGTLNVGTSSSNGNNRIIYSQSNPTDTTRLTLNGGTINVGDGNSRLVIGNDNQDPAFGTETAFSILEITGGTFNLNGAFNLDDANARFMMSSGNFNLNPQDEQNLDSDIHIFDLEQGIVDISGGTITILNPHATSGSGYAMRISGVGGAGNNNDEISGITNLPSGDSPVVFGGNFRFGNGSAQQAGSVDGFDLNLSPDHTYGSFIVYNPQGSNRQVAFITSDNVYTVGNNLIVTAGTLDIGTNRLESDGTGVFSLAAKGHLIIGNTNSADHFPGSNTAFSTYSVDVASTVAYDGVGDALVALPSGQFGNLIIAGSSTKTLNAAETVRSTLTLESGTFTSGSNLTMATGATILRTNGVMTGTIQGTNAYAIVYEGLTKATQTPEWSGSGNKSFTVNLEEDETLSLHQNLTAQDSLTLTEGILADAGFTLTVGGNVNNTSLHTGTGKIYLNGSVAPRTLGGDGTGQFQNLELNDANGAVFSAPQTINGTLTLTSGVMDADNYLLSLTETSVLNAVSPSPTNMIQVNAGVGAAGVQKTYTGAGSESFTWPIGSNGKYTPATIEVINATNSGSITVNPVDAENPFTTDASDVSLEYYWIVSKAGFGFETANLTFTYDQSDASGRGNEVAYVPARYTPTSWSNINNVSLVDEAVNTISFENVTYIEGQFTAAEPSEFGVVLTYYSRADGGWNTAASWSTESLGGAAATTIPGSSTPVIIGNNNTITVSNDNTVAPSVDLQNTGILSIDDATTAHDFGTVIGEGTLNIITNDTHATEFPAGTYTDFLGVTGGTVAYTGTGSYTMLDAPASLHHLSISGSGTVTLPDADIALSGDFLMDETVTVLVSNTTNGDLTINGNATINTSGATFQLQSGTARSVAIGGDFTNEGAFQVAPGGSATHHLSIGGSLTNNNIVDLVNGTGLHRANTIFTKAANASIEGSGGTTEFYRLILDKGTDASSELEVTATAFSLVAPTSGIEKALEIQHGTLVLSEAHTITLSTGGGDFSIPATGGLWVNDAGAAVEITSLSSDLSLAGLLRLTDGTITLGDDLSGIQENSILYTTGNAAITVEGGSLMVGMAIRPNPPTASIVYTQTDGLVQVANNKATNEMSNGSGNSLESVADFSVTAAAESEFNMSGGTLEVVRRNIMGDGRGLWIGSGVAHEVTGGTVRVVTTNTSGGADDDIGISSGVPFYDLEIGEAGAAFSGSVGGNVNEYTLQVLNDFTLNMAGSFKLHRANSGSPSGNDRFDLHIGGDLTIERGTFGFPRPDDDEGVVVFDGSGSQAVTDNDDGAISFFSLGINKSGGTLQLASGTNIAIEKDFTYTNGTFDQNGQTITFNGSVNQTISGSALTLDDVIISNSTGVTVDMSQLTIQGELALDDGVFGIGSNLLSIGAAATITTAGAFGPGTMIQTNGLINDQGVEKTYTTTGAFTFPVGSDVYSLATLNVTDLDGSSGIIRITPINRRDNTAPIATTLDYQWLVETSGFGPNVAITHSYAYDDSDVVGTEATYLDAYFDGLTWIQGDIVNVDELTNLMALTTAGSVNEYQFTAGSGFVDPTVYYSIIDGDWDVSTTWNTASDGSGTNGIPAASNPVVIQSGHTVTIPATTLVSAASTDIEGSGVLDIREVDRDTYIAIGTVNGNGTLQFTVDDTPNVPALHNDFVGSGGGTIAYNFEVTGGVNVTLPSSPTTYNHLTISINRLDNVNNIRNIYLDNDYLINGDLTLTKGHLELNNASTCNRSITGGTFSMASNTHLQVEGSNSFPINFATYDFATDSWQRYSVNNDQIIADLGGDAYGILYINGAGTRTLAGDILVGGYFYLDQNATFNLEANTIDLKGDWVRRANNNNTFNPGTGTVLFSGTSVQYITIHNTSLTNEEETFYSLTISNSNGVALDADGGGNEYVSQLNVTGDLTFTNGTLDLLDRPLTVGGDLINNSGSTMPISNASAVIFNSISVDQEVNGAIGVDFDNMSLAKTSGTTLTLNVPVRIDGTLDLQNDGTITLSGDGLTFGVSAAISGAFSASRMIVTAGTTTGPQVIKEGSASADSYDFTFPIGAGTAYTPVAIDASAVAGVSAGSQIGVRTINNPVTGNFTMVDPLRVVDRFFEVTLTNISDVTGSFLFTYADSDIQGSEIHYNAWWWDGASLDEPANPFTNPATNTFGSTGITISSATSEWVVGESGGFFPRLYSVASDDWSKSTTWNTAANGSGDAGVPTRFNEVEIQAAHAITTDVDDQDAAAVQLDGILEIDGTTNHDFEVISGTGTLVLHEGTIPGYNVVGTTFFDDGSVEFTGAGSYTLPATMLQFNNLMISGGGTKTLGGNITVLNDLSMDNTTLDADNSNNYNVSLGGSISLPNGGSFEPRNGTFALTGSSAQSVPAGITFNNLQFDNVGEKGITTPVSGTFSINHFRILSASGTVAFTTAANIDITGSWSNASGSGASIYANVHDITFTGTNDQSIAGTNAFANMIFNKSGIGHTVTTSGTITLDDGAVGGDLTISADDEISGSADFSLLGDWTNNGAFSTTGTVRFPGTLAQDITGDNAFGTLVIDNAAGVSIADGVTTTIANDLTINSGTLNTGAGTLVFDGTGAQSINGSVTFNNLTKQAGDALTLNGSSTVNGTLTLTEGIINTTDADLLIIGPDGDVNVTDETGNTFVNGPLQHTENSITVDEKLFPFGSNGFYRPITLYLTQLDFTERAYTGRLTEGMPTERTLPADLVRVSGIRYYTISQLPASTVAAAIVKIQYNADDRSDVASTLRIAKSDGAGNWLNIGGISSIVDEIVDTFEGGTIMSDPFTTFSDFTLASSEESNNPLPIELLDFQATPTVKGVNVNWVTASETNNSHFVLERSLDGLIYSTVARVEGKGNSVTQQYYENLDTHAPYGLIYYRLQQVDFDGEMKFFRTVAVMYAPQAAQINIQPNPVENRQTTLTALGLTPRQKVTIQLVNLSGFTVREYHKTVDSDGTLTMQLQNLDQVAAGLYTVVITSSQLRHVEKLLIR